MNHGANGTAVTAVPDTGYHFVKLERRRTDGSPRTDSNVTADISVTANFAINTYTLTYTAGANGSISRDHAADGELRRGRDRGDGGAGRRLPLRQLERRRADGGPDRHSTCTADISVTATLRHQHLHPDLHGRRQRHDQSAHRPQTVNHGATGTAVTAVPDAGYHFVSWSDGV